MGAGGGAVCLKLYKQKVGGFLFYSYSHSNLHDTGLALTDHFDDRSVQ